MNQRIIDLHLECSSSSGVTFDLSIWTMFGDEFTELLAFCLEITQFTRLKRMKLGLGRKITTQREETKKGRMRSIREGSGTNLLEKDPFYL